MRLSIALTSLAFGCGGAEPSTRVVLRTDAPAGLFDRVAVEVRVNGVDCDGCRRDLPASAFDGEVSFAVVADRASVVHVTLLRERGRPMRRETSLEVFATFGPQAEQVEVPLSWRRVGAPQGSWEAPLPPERLERLAPDVSNVCAVQLSDGEACVPAGLFWFGDPLLDLGGGIDAEGNAERLVSLSPFVIDRHEVTLAELVATGARPWPGCESFGPEDAVACVSWAQARRYCTDRGKRLPTEAELEYLMGGLRSQRTPWGDSAPVCADAIYGRTACGHAGPQPPGSGARDRLELTGGAVLDLVGNVSEWTEDVWGSTSGPCFERPVSFDPICAQAAPSLPDHRVVKGASWFLSPFYLGAAVRLRSPQHGSDPSLGFRCARGGAQ